MTTDYKPEPNFASALIAFIAILVFASIGYAIGSGVWLLLTNALGHITSCLGGL